MDQLLHHYGLSQHAIIGFLVAIAVFASVLSVALPLLSGNELKSRMKAVALERDEVRARERARMSAENERGRATGGRRRSTEKGMAEAVVERFDLKKALADDKTVGKLRVAGYRGERALTRFLFMRAILPIALLLFSMLYVFGLGLLADRPAMVRLIVCLAVGVFGFYLPNIYVSNQAGKRKKSIQRAWPDALDLLLICVEAGNSIESAFRRVSDEIGIQSVPLAEEIVLLCAELAYLSDRKMAYDNFSARTGLDAVRSVCTTLIQAEKYGTPLGHALRVLSQESRDARMNLAEKKAAALPPKLTVPMIVFFLPVLFAVIIGPAIIQMMHTL